MYVYMYNEKRENGLKMTIISGVIQNGVLPELIARYNVILQNCNYRKFVVQRNNVTYEKQIEQK